MGPLVLSTELRPSGTGEKRGEKGGKPSRSLDEIGAAYLTWVQHIRARTRKRGRKKKKKEFKRRTGIPAPSIPDTP